jgi:hypothetical protein
MRTALQGLLFLVGIAPIACAARMTPHLDEARTLTLAKATPEAGTGTASSGLGNPLTDAPATARAPGNAAAAEPVAIDAQVPAEIEGAEDPWSAYHVMPGKDVLRAIGPVQAKVKACIVRGLEQDPSASGHVRIRFVVKQTGEVLDWKDEASSSTDDPITRCVGALVKSLTFPEQKAIGNSLGLYTLDVSR